MARTAAESEAPKPEVDITSEPKSSPANPASLNFTPEQLIALFSSAMEKTGQAQAQGQEKFAEIIAKALVDAKAPYVDPRAAENEKAAREQARQQMKDQKAGLAAFQATCPHIAGCNSLSELMDSSGRTCIVWHVSDVQDELGICTNCTRVFQSTDPDYFQWRRKPSINKPSRSGHRQFPDLMKAQKAARQ
jgi:hypothetical protein